MQSSNAPRRNRESVAVALALILGACSNDGAEKAQSRPAPVAQVPVTATSPAPQYAPGEALKERLARQEAAEKLLNAAPPPAPARTAEPPKPAAPARAIEDVKAPPPPAARPLVAAKEPPAKIPERVAIAAPTPSPPPAPAAKAEPVKIEPPAAPRVETAPPPRTEVALAKPQAAAAATRLLQRVEPDFPREAIQAGEEKGLVQARMLLDEHGNVTRVEVLEARPRRLFDRSVIRALSQWKYNDGTAGRAVEVEIAFRK